MVVHETMKKLNAREVLSNINFDLKRMLEDDTPTKNILFSLKNRLEKIKDTKYQKIDWS